MRILKPLSVAAFTLLTLLLLALPTPAKAQNPAYMQALSDLRSAREYLLMDQRPQYADARRHAINGINDAINDVRQAAFREGKDVWHAPAPQSGGDPAAPFHTAVKLLHEARRDVMQGYDLPENSGLRERSVKRIDDALSNLEPFL